MGTCLEWGESRVEECSDWRDEGRSECSDWDDRCCTWWPCSWGCKLITWVCVAAVWISSWVCAAYTVVTTVFCVVWDVVTTVVNVILVTLESILGWIVSAVGFVIELIEAIPILGTLIRWVVNFVTWLVWTIVAIPDFVLGLIGIRPEKKLRVCTVILRDEKGTPTASVDYAVALLQLAADLYKRDANVRIVPHGPFQYDSGFAGAERVGSEWVQTATGNADADLLDPPCGAGGEWGLAGSKFQLLMSANCFFGSWRRLTGYGGPVACLIVRDVPDAWGCALWITDYATIDGGQLPPGNQRVLGHEVGHACNLWHFCVDDDVRNLMGAQTACDPDSTAQPDYFDPRMTNAQVLLVRASKHVTYF